MLRRERDSGLPASPRQEGEEEEDDDEDRIMNQPPEDAAAAAAAAAAAPVIIAPAQAIVHGAQLNSIPKFHGNKEEDIELWVSTFDRARDQFNWSDRAAAAAAKSKLEGKAGTWLRSEELVLLQHAEWTGDDGLKAALLQRFCPVPGAVAAVNAVLDLKQRQEELVSEFYDRVILAMDKKNSTLTRAERQTGHYQAQLSRDIYTFFAAGLLSEYRESVFSLEEPPVTHAALLKASRNAEAVSRDKRGRKTTLFEVDAKEISVAEDQDGKEAARSDTAEENVIARVDSLWKARGQGGNRGRGQRGGRGGRGQGPNYASYKCFNCEGYGHISKYCTTRPRVQGQGRGRTYNEINQVDANRWQQTLN